MNNPNTNSTSNIPSLSATYRQYGIWLGAKTLFVLATIYAIALTLILTLSMASTDISTLSIGATVGWLISNVIQGLLLFSFFGSVPAIGVGMLSGWLNSALFLRIERPIPNGLAVSIGMGIGVCVSIVFYLLFWLMVNLAFPFLHYRQPIGLAEIIQEYFTMWGKSTGDSKRNDYPRVGMAWMEATP